MSELTNQDLTTEEKAVLDAYSSRYSKHELAQIGARRAAQEFMDSTPSFHPSEINLSLLCDWMQKMEMLPTVSSFEKAFMVLQDVLEEAPEVDPHAPGPAERITSAQIEAMSSEEFRKRLADPAFAKRVEEIENQKPNRWGESRKRR